MRSSARQDVYIGAVFLLIAAAVLFETSGLSAHSRELPRLCSFAVAVFGAVMIIRALIAEVSIPRLPGAESGRYSAVTGKPFAVFDTLVICAALLITSLVIPYLGFYSTILIFIWFVFHFYDRTFTLRQAPRGLAFSLSVIVFLYLVFGLFMKLPVPKGFLP